MPQLFFNKMVATAFIMEARNDHQNRKMTLNNQQQQGTQLISGMIGGFAISPFQYYWTATKQMSQQGTTRWDTFKFKISMNPGRQWEIYKAIQAKNIWHGALLGIGTIGAKQVYNHFTTQS